jgi:hypothetical protein
MPARAGSVSGAFLRSFRVIFKAAADDLRIEAFHANRHEGNREDGAQRGIQIENFDEQNDKPFIHGKRPLGWPCR